jgi:hypothetical protein
MWLLRAIQSTKHGTHFRLLTCPGIVSFSEVSAAQLSRVCFVAQVVRSFFFCLSFANQKALLIFKIYSVTTIDSKENQSKKIQSIVLEKQSYVIPPPPPGATEDNKKEKMIEEISSEYTNHRIPEHKLPIWHYQVRFLG